MRYAQRELERWLTVIDDHSRGRVDRIEAHLTNDPDLFGWLMSRPDHRERLFAALASGDMEYVRSRSPEWVSWIEDNPPYLWLSTRPTVTIDLDERRTDGRLFRDKYGCTPEQFARLLRHRPWDRPGPALVNLRANDVMAYAKRDAGQVLGPILAVADEHPERFYRLQHVRAAAFRLLGLDWTGIGERAKVLGADYRRRYNSLRVSGSKPGLEVTRDGEWPVPDQFDGRIAYYLAINVLAERHGTPKLGDQTLDEWLAVDDAATIDFPRQNMLRDRLARLYLHHHLMSAPLTGGLGGDYAMLAREVDHATESVIDPQLFQRNFASSRRSGRVGLATWMFRQQAGMDPRPGKKPPGLGSGALARFPDDHQFTQFLGRVDHNRVTITADRGAGEDEIEQAVDRIASRRRRTARSLDVEEEIELYRDMIDIGARDGCKVPAAVLGGVGVATAATALMVGPGTATGIAAVSLSIGNLCQVMEKARNLLSGFTWGERFANGLEETTSKLCQKHMDRVRIDRFAGMIWRP